MPRILVKLFVLFFHIIDWFYKVGIIIASTLQMKIERHKEMKNLLMVIQLVSDAPKWFKSKHPTLEMTFHSTTLEQSPLFAVFSHSTNFSVALLLTAAAAKSLQSCPTLCDPIDGSPPGSPIPGILQARTLDWVAISFSTAWKWKVKVKSLSRVWLFTTP